MEKYDKINTVFKRETHGKNRIIEWDFSLPEFDYLKDNIWDFTEKVDGTCIRVMIEGPKEEGTRRISFGGKTDTAQIPAVLVEWLRQKFDPQIERLLVAFPDGACLYGEGYGPKIQKGGGNYGEVGFALFDVKVGGFWLQRPNLLNVAEGFDLRPVPLIGQGSLPEMVRLVREGIKSQWGDFRAEGIVARPHVELRQRNGNRVITKLKCRDFDTTT